MTEVEFLIRSCCEPNLCAELALLSQQGADSAKKSQMEATRKENPQMYQQSHNVSLQSGQHLTKL